MPSDEQVKQALRRRASSVDVDVDRALDDVRRGHHIAVVRRRWQVVAAAAAVAVIVTLAAPTVVRVLRGLAVEPVAPAPAPSPLKDASQPFTIIGSVDLASLGVTRPLRAAPGPDGTVYVTDANDTVNVVTSDGRLLRSWGSPGTGPGQFRFGSGSIAVADDGKLYVSDAGNFRVQVFSATGRFLQQFGSFGTGPGQFEWPFDVTVDPQGFVYVADDRQMTVSQFSPTGRFMWRVGGASEGRPELVGHEHVLGVDPSGHVVLANDDKGLVVSLDGQGHVVDVFGDTSSGGYSSSTHPPTGLFPGGVCSASVDSAGYTVTGDCGERDAENHVTRLFDPAHALVGVWDSPVWMPQFGPDGNLWALDRDGQLVRISVTRPS